MMDSMDLLIHAHEYPNDRGLWCLGCDDVAPVSETLFPSMMRAHFGSITLQEFASSDVVSTYEGNFIDFDDESLLHINQLEMQQVYAVYHKLEFAYLCLREKRYTHFIYDSSTASSSSNSDKESVNPFI